MIDLENHVSITSAPAIEKIIAPVKDAFGIKFFRYLKLYKNGKRVVLSNIPDAIRYAYTQGAYTHLWYDGAFPTFLKEGWHNWHLNRLLDERAIEEKIENDLTSLLGVHHGTTLVQEHLDHYEIFSFDAMDKIIYQVDQRHLLRFTYYFKEQAKKLIAIGEIDAFFFPLNNSVDSSKKNDALIHFLNNTKIHRYYLGGQHEGTYLTGKEASCVRWVIQGKSAKEIARLENIQSKTVERHMENIKNKLCCQKQTQLIQIISQAGFLDIIS